MSGARLFSFREGDRSEYLAQYLLSGLGLVTPVPRQEDIGFDFVCSIADDEVGFLTFNHQYIVSAKSIGTPNVELDPPDNHRDELPHINWLFRLDLPLFVAVIDKYKSELAVYSTLPIWLLRYSREFKECGALHLIPRTTSKSQEDTGYPKRGMEIKDWPGKFVFKADLGFPIIRITPEVIQNRDRLRAAKERLRLAVSASCVTTRHHRMGIPYAYWFNKTSADGSDLSLAFFVGSIADIPEAKRCVYESIAPTMASLAMMYKVQPDKSKLEALGNLLREAADAVPPQVKEALPEIFKRGN